MELSKIRVLVVDDSRNMRKTIKSSLESLGYSEIKEAENGANALSLLKQESFGLVLLDWNMPVMSGVETLRMMRADASLKTLPVVMVTAESEKNQVVQAIAEGVTDYLLKPFNVETLKTKVEKALA